MTISKRRRRHAKNASPSKKGRTYAATPSGRIRVFVGFGPDGKRILINRTVQSSSKKDAESRRRTRSWPSINRAPSSRPKCTMEDLFNEVVKDYKINGQAPDWRNGTSGYSHAVLRGPASRRR